VYYILVCVRMTCRANSLKSSGIYKAELMQIAKLLIRQVDDEIKAAFDSGKYRVVVSVPVTFQLKYGKNSDAQRIIYHTLLTSLIERDFLVEIDMQQESTLFNISWVSADEEEEIQMQNMVLARHSVQRKKN